MGEKGYVPPYTITNKTVNLISDISEILTKLTINDAMNQNPKLRRENRIQTIHASLAIENNSLSLDQVTDIINGKRVLGAPREICEVKNAFEVYERLLQMNPYSIKDMLTAHKVLMNELTEEAGVFRSGRVGIFAGEVLVHMAPPADKVPQLISELINWTLSAEAHPLIKSCVFHYEFEFIHPFADGNGRMGRMWQTLLLYQENPVFGWLPVETIVANRQSEYYDAIQRSTKENDSAIFAEFMLTALAEAIAEFKNNQGSVGTPLEPPLSKTEQSVLDTILSNPYATYQEIAQKIDKTPKTVQRALVSLKDRGIVSRVGSDKTGHWVISNT